MIVVRWHDRGCQGGVGVWEAMSRYDEMSKDESYIIKDTLGNGNMIRHDEFRSSDKSWRQGCQQRISCYPLFKKNAVKIPSFSDFLTIFPVLTTFLTLFGPYLAKIPTNKKYRPTANGRYTDQWSVYRPRWQLWDRQTDGQTDRYTDRKTDRLFSLVVKTKVFQNVNRMSKRQSDRKEDIQSAGQTDRVTE